MKTIKNPILAILAVIMINLSACSPILYSTVGQNVPLFREKGEVALNAGLAVSGNSNYFGTTGINVQLAVAPTNSLAVISSFYSLKESDGTGKGNYFELGIGKFKYNPKSNLTGEIFFGAGLGSIKSSPDGYQISSDFLKVFIQPSGGFTSKVFDIAFTPRVGVVNFLSHKNEGNEQEINQFFSDKKTTVVFEPGITLRLGFKNVKLQYQYNYSTFNYNSNGYNDFDLVNDTFMSFNLYFLMTERWAK